MAGITLNASASGCPSSSPRPFFVFALLTPLAQARLLQPKEIIRRARGNKLLQFGHVLVTLSTPLLLAVALHFNRLLSQSPWGWAGFVGGAIAILGTIILAADKGALCLTMSAFDTLPEKEFTQIMPGVMTMFEKKGWMVLLWGIVLLPIGFALQAVGQGGKYPSCMAEPSDRRLWSPFPTALKSLT